MQLVSNSVTGIQLELIFCPAERLNHDYKCMQNVLLMVVGNGEHMWYLSQVKGPAEDDSIEGNTIDRS